MLGDSARLLTQTTLITVNSVTAAFLLSLDLLSLSLSLSLARSLSPLRSLFSFSLVSSSRPSHTLVRTLRGLKTVLCVWID